MDPSVLVTGRAGRSCARARSATSTTPAPALLLMVASDRISAFDVVFAEPIPHKGRVLTAMTAFWCDEMADVVDNALLSTTRRDRRRPSTGVRRAGRHRRSGRCSSGEPR